MEAVETRRVCALEGCTEPAGPTSHHRYCSIKHQHRAQNLRRNLNQEPEYRTCPYCGMVFETIQKNKVYCCPPHAREAEIERRKKQVDQGEVPYTLRVRERPEGWPVLAFSDLQRPFHDEVALEAVLRFGDDFIGDGQGDIIQNGDIGDNEAISSFLKNPYRQTTFREEVEDMRSFEIKLRARYPNAEIYFNAGNHEDRTRLFIWNRVPELAGMNILTIPELYQLPERNIIYLPYHSVIDYLGFSFTHGNWTRLNAGATAKAHFEKMLGSGACGHCHRAGTYRHNSTRGTHAWHEMGCLCLMRQDYLQGQTPNWQQAFLYGRVYNGKLHVDVPHIYPDGFMAEGRFYKRG
jgi:hypothetical protein